MATVPAAIPTKVQLDKALGVTKASTPQFVSDKWMLWSAQFPEEKSKLSPALIVALDALAGIVTIYDTMITLITTIESAVVLANNTYSIALSLLPGIGAADSGKKAVSTAMTVLKGQMATVIAKIKAMPQNIYSELTNITVDESAMLG